MNEESLPLPQLVALFQEREGHEDQSSQDFKWLVQVAELISQRTQQNRFKQLRKRLELRGSGDLDSKESQWFSQMITQEALWNQKALAYAQKGFDGFQDMYFGVKLAFFLRQLSRFKDAQAVLQQLLQKDDSCPQVPYELGILHEQLKNRTQALEYYHKSLSRDPDFEKARAACALLCERLLKDDEFELHIKSLPNQPQTAEAYVARYQFHASQQEWQMALECITAATEMCPEKILWLYHKADALEKLGEYDQAIKTYTEANFLYNPRVFSCEQFTAEYQALNLVLDEVATHKPSKQNKVVSQQPVFVVANIRTGSTLLTEILGHHSHYVSIGESGLFDRVLMQYAQQKNTSVDLLALYRQLWVSDDQSLVSELKTLTQEFLQKNYPQSSAQCFVDKSPTNVRYIPLIAKLYPESPVVHLIRDGREASFSAYKRVFHGYHWQKYSLENALTHWVQTINLAQKSFKVFEMPVFELRYEDLVSNPENVLTELCGFLHCDYEAECLEFYKDKKDVGTNSYRQVKQQIHKTPINFAQTNYPQLWKNLQKNVTNTLKTFNYPTESV